MAPWFETLHRLFHERTAPGYRIVEATVYLLVVLSLSIIFLEISLEKDNRWLGTLRIVDNIILGIFALEVGLRVVTYIPPEVRFFDQIGSRRVRSNIVGRLRFCLRPLVLIDLITVLALVPALRGLRALRLLQLIRTSRWFRYSDPFYGLARAIEENRLLFGFGLSIMGSTVVLAGLSIYLIEAQHNPSIDNLADGLWWAIVTLATVGFGDISPVTTMGRGVAAVTMVSGMFTLALFAGIVSHALLNAVLSLRQEQFRMSGNVDHVVVCGYRPSARMLVDALLAEGVHEGRSVVLMGTQERPPRLPPEFAWISGDPTKESELAKVRLPYARAIVVIGDRQLMPQQADATTLLTLFTIRSFLDKQAEVDRATPIYVVAEVLDSENVAHARTAGANEVIESTRMGFSLLAHAVTNPGTAAIMSDVASVGAHSLYVGRLSFEEPEPYGELARRLKRENNVLLLGVRRDGEDQINPADDLMVSSADRLLYLAREESLPHA